MATNKKQSEASCVLGGVTTTGEMATISTNKGAAQHLLLQMGYKGEYNVRKPPT